MHEAWSYGGAEAPAVAEEDLTGTVLAMAAAGALS